MICAQRPMSSYGNGSNSTQLVLSMNQYFTITSGQAYLESSPESPPVPLFLPSRHYRFRRAQLLFDRVYRGLRGY